MGIYIGVPTFIETTVSAFERILRLGDWVAVSASGLREHQVIQESGKFWVLARGLGFRVQDLGIWV